MNNIFNKLKSDGWAVNRKVQFGGASRSSCFAKVEGKCFSGSGSQPFQTKGVFQNAAT